MASSFADGTVRVTTPPTYDADRPGPARGLPDPSQMADAMGKDALVAALQESDLNLVETVDLTPRRSQGSRCAGRRRRGTVELEVDVPPDEDAVVLLERDGVYSWHLPVDAGRRTRSLEPGPRTRRFEIDVQPGHAPLPPARRRPPRPGTARAASSRAPRTPSSSASSRLPWSTRRSSGWRATSRPGSGPSDRHRRVELEALREPRRARPADRSARPGCCSSSTARSPRPPAASARWPSARTARASCARLIFAYDAVIGFDHKTLSVDPKQNAEDLLARLRTHQPDARARHRRDHAQPWRPGHPLVRRAGAARPRAGPRASTTSCSSPRPTPGPTSPIRSGGPTSSTCTPTSPASPRAVLALAGAVPVAAIVSGVVRGIGAFVKYLVSYAATGDDVPGLKAMVPGGAFVTEINELQPGQPGPGH